MLIQFIHEHFPSEMTITIFKLSFVHRIHTIEYNNDKYKCIIKHIKRVSRELPAECVIDTWRELSDGLYLNCSGYHLANFQWIWTTKKVFINNL